MQCYINIDELAGKAVKYYQQVKIPHVVTLYYPELKMNSGLAPPSEAFLPEGKFYYFTAADLRAS